MDISLAARARDQPVPPAPVTSATPGNKVLFCSGISSGAYSLWQSSSQLRGRQRVSLTSPVCRASAPVGVNGVTGWAIVERVSSQGLLDDPVGPSGWSSRPLTSSTPYTGITPEYTLSVLVFFSKQWRGSLLSLILHASSNALMLSHASPAPRGARRSSIGAAKARVCVHCGRNFRRTEHLERHIRTRMHSCCMS